MQWAREGLELCVQACACVYVCVCVYLCRKTEYYKITRWLENMSLLTFISLWVLAHILNREFKSCLFLFWRHHSSHGWICWSLVMGLYNTRTLICFSTESSTFPLEIYLSSLVVCGTVLWCSGVQKRNSRCHLSLSNKDPTFYQAFL